MIQADYEAFEKGLLHIAHLSYPLIYPNIE